MLGIVLVWADLLPDAIGAGDREGASCRRIFRYALPGGRRLATRIRDVAHSTASAGLPGRRGVLRETAQRRSRARPDNPTVCLACGAYKVVSLEKPLILSATPVLRGYFRTAAIYTEDTPGAIFQAILANRGGRKEMRRRVSGRMRHLPPC